MQTKADIHREVRWTDLAIKDLKFIKITKGEWKSIHAEVERISRVENIDLDYAVCRIVQCRNLWYRIKIRRPSQIRVAFTVDGQPPRIVIQAVVRRTERTYDILQIFFRTRK